MTGFENPASLVELLGARALEHPDRPAYTFLLDGEREGAHWTYSELESRARAIGASLQNSGLSGSRALLLYPPGLDFVAAFLGCLYAGVTAVPAYPSTSKRTLPRLLAIVRDARPTAILSVDSMFSKLRTLSRRDTAFRDLKLVATDQVETEDARDWTAPDVGPQTIAFLQYTSGSTASPKGVMVSHRNLLYNFEMIRQACGQDRDSTHVSWLPMHHDMGLIGMILQAAYLGSSCVLMSPVAFLQRPIRWLKAISRYRGHTCGAPNFAFDLCVDRTSPEERENLDLSSWKVVINASEPVRAETFDRFTQTFADNGLSRSSLKPLYGLAEATVFVTGGTPGQRPTIRPISGRELDNSRVVVGDEKAPDTRRVVACGRPVMDERVVLVDPETMKRCADGTVGEIWVAGPNVAEGYWNRQEQSLATFGARIDGSGEGPFLRTGDLGFWIDGELCIAGRLKDLIIIRGQNYYPEDLELSVARSHRALRTTAAFSVEAGGEESLVILAEVEKGLPDVARQGILDAMHQAVVSSHQVQPHALALVRANTLPRTTSGKIQRHACRRTFLAEDFKPIARWSQPGGASPATVMPGWAAGLNGSETPANGAGDQAALSRPAPDELVAESRSRAHRDRLIDWLRDYAGQRINSRLIDERRSVPPYIVLDFANQGLFGMQVPERYGGLGMHTTDMLRVMEQIAAVDTSLATLLGINNTLGIRPILRFASPALKDELLPVLAAGRELAAFAITEAGAGSYIRAITARAVPDGTDQWRLHGTKIWSGNAAWAGVINVFARLAGPGDGGAMCGFALRSGTPGLSTGAEALTMGMRGLVQSTVLLDGVPVSRANLLGSEPGDGLEIAKDTMRFARLGIGVICIGGMKRCAQLMLRYATRRTISSGRLLDNPVTLARLSELTAAIPALEALIYGIAERVDAGSPVPEEAFDACKTIAPELMWRAVDDLVQLLGGRGYIETNEATQILRDTRLFRIFEGPTETLNMHLGARVMNQGEFLNSFLERDLSAPDIASSLTEAARQIRERHLKGKSGFFALPGQAGLRWTHVTIGELASRALVWAFARQADLRASSMERRRSAEWACGRFEAAAKAALEVSSSEAVLIASEAIEGLITDYATAIGDVEKTAAGEDHEVDAMLWRATDRPAEQPRSEPVAAAAQAPPDATPAPPDATPAADSQRDGREIEQWIVSWIAERMEMPAGSIDPRQHFAFYGLDSVTGVQMAMDLEEWLGITIDPTLIWEYPAIEDVVRHLDPAAAESAGVVSDTAGEQEVATGGLEGMLADLEQLSEEEAAAAIEASPSAG